MKLTERSIGKITPPAKSHGPRDVPDSLLPGLVLSVKPSGLQVWCVRYRHEGKQRRYTIGNAAAIPVGTARKRARKILEQVADGIDPQAEKLRLRAGDATDSFPSLAARFVQSYSRPRNRTWRDQARVLGLRNVQRDPALEPDWQVIPGSPAARWERRLVRTITKRDVMDAIDDVMKRGPIAANKAYATLSRFFGWLVERGILDASPMIGTKPPSPTRQRERVLSIEELQIVWRAAYVLGRPFSAFVHLLIVTGQRRSEVAGIARSEITDDVWTIPKERSKNGEEHELPLPPSAVALLEYLPAEGLLLTTTGHSPISGFSKLKKRLDARIIREGKSLDPWTLHDLRRSVATGLAAIGTEPHIIEAVQNRRTGEIEGVARTYNRHPYFNEKREALGRWGALFTELVNESSLFG